jgi:hypothetical protein
VLTHVHDAYPKKNLTLTEQSVTARRGEGALRIAEPVSQVMIGARRNWSLNVRLWNLAATRRTDRTLTTGDAPGVPGRSRWMAIL